MFVRTYGLMYVKNAELFEHFFLELRRYYNHWEQRRQPGRHANGFLDGAFGAHVSDWSTCSMSSATRTWSVSADTWRSSNPSVTFHASSACSWPGPSSQFARSPAAWRSCLRWWTKSPRWEAVLVFCFLKLLWPGRGKNVNPKKKILIECDSILRQNNGKKLDFCPQGLHENN